MGSVGGVAADIWPQRPDMAQSFVGLSFDDVSLGTALDHLAARGAEAPFAYVVTPNVDHVVRLTEVEPSSELAAAYRYAWMCLCDSRVLSLLARLRGIRLEVVSGSDLVADLLSRGFDEGDRIALVGSNKAGAAWLRSAHPSVRIFHHAPPMGLLTDEDALSSAVEFIISSKARYALLAVGSPQQELLAYRALVSGRAIGTGLCIGASIDFITGHRRRAPHWMRRLCLEWLHRLISDPRRLWKRYLVTGPRIFGIVLRSRGSD